MFRKRSHWPSVSEQALIARLSAGGTVLDAGQREALGRLVHPHVHGVYLWGNVGRGKTWMADAFFSLAPGEKRRLHIHQLLSALNAAITEQRGSFSTALSTFLGQSRFLYLDEFHLHDVGDTVLLRRAVATALETPLTLLMTSNYPPQELLPHPLYHHHAEGLIELISSNVDVVHIADGKDHRSSVTDSCGFASGTWTVGKAQHDGNRLHAVALGSGGRTLWAYAADKATLTVDFDQLCRQPLSAADYTHLASQFTLLRLTGIPHPAEIEEEPMQRFAFLIDVLVNADRRLEITAATEREAWDTAKNLPRDAARLLSRLSLLRRPRESGANCRPEAQLPPGR